MKSADMQMLRDEERCGWNIAARKMADSSASADEWESAPTPTFTVHFPRAFYRTLFLFLVGMSSTNAQYPLFGTVKSAPVPGLANRMTLLPGSRTHAARILLWSEEDATALLGTFNDDRSAITWSHRQFPHPVHSIAVTDIRGDGSTDLIAAGSADSILYVISQFDGDTLKAALTLRLPFIPGGISPIAGAAHGLPNLLLFRPDNPGIIPVTGLERKQPRLGSTIARDMAVGGLATGHLNDDGITDIIAYDWVHSELHLLYGVGRTRFLDQTTFPVADGVSQFVVTESESHDLLDIVIVSSDSLGIQVWHGDGLGNFKPLKSYKASSAVRTLRARDCDGDGWPDVSFIDSRGVLHSLLNMGAEEIEEGTEVAAGGHSSSFEFLSAAGRALVVFDAAETQLLVYEDSRSRSLADSLCYATGLGPSSLLVEDVNKDGHPDIVVATTTSKSLEFFLSDTSGAFAGATVLHLNEECRLLGFHSISDSLAQFVVSSPGRNAISFVTYHRFDQSHSEALIPDVGALEPLSPVQSSEGKVEYFCYAAPGESATSSLTLFQQLGGSRFIERNFKLTIPDVLMGAAVANIDKDRYIDAAYVYRNAGTGKYECVIAHGDSAGEFGRRGISFQLSDTAVTKSYLYFADVNKDSLLDLLLCFPKEARTMQIALGDSSGAFSDARKLEENIGFENRAQLQLLDADSDGNVDIVVNDPVRGGVGYLKGSGQGGFEPWQPLYVASGISHFGLEDFNNDGIKDLAVTLKSRGVLILLSGTHIFQR